MPNNPNPNGKVKKQQGSNKKYKIDKLTQSSGGQVSWASDDTSFRIWFPPARYPFQETRETDGVTYTKGYPAIARTLLTSLTSGDSYEYSIFCTPDNVMAESNSSPEVIIL